MKFLETKLGSLLREWPKPQIVEKQNEFVVAWLSRFKPPEPTRNETTDPQIAVTEFTNVSM
jgi:hypothetical protein